MPSGGPGKQAASSNGKGEAQSTGTAASQMQPRRRSSAEHELAGVNARCTHVRTLEFSL